MKKTYWVMRILPWIGVSCLLASLLACTTVSSPHEPEFATTADDLSYPKRIALLLPLQGELSVQGNAVRDGFFAAYYLDAKTREVGLPSLIVMDTHDDKRVVDAYQRALAQGADFIVGPLTKPALELLIKTGNPQVPILALNTLDNFSESKVYQFGLSPENEATQVAIRAYQRGGRKALVFIQQGSWGERVSNAFTESFIHAGGEVVQVEFFTPRDNMSEVVKKALLIEGQEDAAVRRANRMKTGAQFAMKPRDDVDMVFMAAMPMQARQIPPLLAFYYAKSWPIYATASVYSGTPNPKMDADLNGVTFCDIPWLIETPQHNPVGTPDTAVMQLWPTQPRPQLRLYAMGVDAYGMIPLLPRMSVDSHIAFDGATGVLQLNDRQQVQRTLPCTQFVQGVPVKTDGR